VFFRIATALFRKEVSLQGLAGLASFFFQLPVVLPLFPERKPFKDLL